MIIEILWILFSLVLLFLGAEGLVRGSASLGLRAGLSPLVVGLTIVAFGTSSPELVVSIKSALAGQGGIALGNVVGSNIFNVLAILGISSLTAPLGLGGISTLDIGFMIGFSILLLPLLWTGLILRRVEGGLLLAGYRAYLWLLWPK